MSSAGHEAGGRGGSAGPGHRTAVAPPPLRAVLSQVPDLTYHALHLPRDNGQGRPEPEAEPGADPERGSPMTRKEATCHFSFANPAAEEAG